MQGTMKSTVIGSFFLCCHYNSELARSLFLDNPEYNGNKISIIQLMKIDNGYLLIEVVKK